MNHHELSEKKKIIGVQKIYNAVVFRPQAESVQSFGEKPASRQVSWREDHVTAELRIDPVSKLLSKKQEVGLWIGLSPRGINYSSPPSLALL